MANTRPSTQKPGSDSAFETAMQKVTEFGHDIKQAHWTQGERGFSNVCLNCGRVIGVLKTGDLWGTALNGPCPDQRWHAVSKKTGRESSPGASAGDVAGVEPSKHQTIKGLVLFLGLLAIPFTLIAVLVHFQLLSGLLVILARIGLTISAILLIVAVFRRAGFKLALLMFGFSICLALLSVLFMSPKQRAEWQTKEQQAQQKVEADRKAQSSPAVPSVIAPVNAAPLNDRLREHADVDGRLRAYNLNLRFDSATADKVRQAILQARSWTDRQVAPNFPDFETEFRVSQTPGSEFPGDGVTDMNLCNDLDSGTCLWRTPDMGGIHLKIGFTVMDSHGTWISPQRRLTYCDVWDKSIPAKELPVVGKWFTCRIYDENREGRGHEWPVYRP